MGHAFREDVPAGTLSREVLNQGVAAVNHPGGRSIVGIQHPRGHVDIRYAAGRDPQLERGVQEVLRMLEQAPPVEVVDHRRELRPKAVLEQLQAREEVQVWAEADAKAKVEGRDRHELAATETTLRPSSLAAFLNNHAGHIRTCDFTVAHDLLFRALYIFVVMELQSRRIVHTAVTRSPTDDWTAQQLREATPWGKGPRYLIRDRDKKYGARFSNVAKCTGIKVLKTPVRAPKANAICERFIGSLKRECLDHMFTLHSYQLHRVVQSYVDYTTTQDSIRASGSACPLDSLGPIPHHQAQPPLSRCWAAYTTPIPVLLICTNT